MPMLNKGGESAHCPIMTRDVMNLVPCMTSCPLARSRIEDGAELWWCGLGGEPFEHDKMTEARNA